MKNIHQDQSTTMIKRARRNTIGDLLTRTAARYPNKLALTYKHRKVTYLELEQLVNQTAHGLIKDGIKKGDKLALLSKNNLDFVIINFAVARIGAVLIPVNYMLTEKDISYILNHAGVDGLFATVDYRDVLDQAAEGLNIEHRYILETDETTDIPSAWRALSEVQYNQETTPIEIDIDDDDLAHVLYTSGTESAPKGAMLSHKSIISEYVSCVVDGQMSSDDILVHALPFYHSAQLHVFLGPSIYLGASGIILDTASPDVILETIEKEGATQLFAPPTVWITPVCHPGFDSRDLSTLDKCYYGAASMPREVLKELSERLPNAKFWNFYGQTEVAPLATALQPE